MLWDWPPDPTLGVPSPTPARKAWGSQCRATRYSPMSVVNSRNLQKPGPYSSSRVRAVGTPGGWAVSGTRERGQPPPRGALTKVFEHMEILALPVQGHPQNGVLLVVRAYHVGLPVAWGAGGGEPTCTGLGRVCLHPVPAQHQTLQ